MTDMTNQAIKLDAVPEVADAGQAVLHLLRAGRHARPAPRAEGVDRQVQGQVRPGLGQAPRRDARPADQGSASSPPDTKLAPKPEAIKDWDKLSPDEKKLFARQMEVFAGFGEYTDYEIGRLIQAIEDLGQLDNTLIFYVVGDNGASAEGTMNGAVQRDDLFQRRPRNRCRDPQALRRPGRPESPTATTPPAGPWPAIRPSPGPSRSPAATAARKTRWSFTGPSGIKAKGEIRSQWHHVIDIAPTVLEAAGLPEPKVGQRHGADAHRRREHGLHLRQRQGEEHAQDAVLRDLRQPRHLSRRLAGPHGSQSAVGGQAAAKPFPKTSGSSTTRRRTSARRTTWPRRTPTSSRKCRRCS